MSKYKKGKNNIIAGALLLMTVFLCSGCGSAVSVAHTEAGYTALLSSDYMAAEEAFSAALAQGEDPVSASRGLGIALMGQARYGEAIEAFNQALAATDDKMPETVLDLLQYKASAQYRLKDYDGTIRTCDQLVELDGKLVDAYYFRGAAYLCRSELDKARVNFDYAVSLDPGNYDLYLNIYSVYEQMKLSGIGDEYLQTALSITPDSTDSYVHIGQIYFYLEQYDEAQKALIEPVKANYVPALSLMGQIYLARGDYDNARAIYNQIQSIEGANVDSYNGLALCALQSGDPDSALVYIGEGLALEGNQGKQELYFNEIVAYERKLDFVMAREKCRAYAERYPTDQRGQKELTFLSTR